MAGRESRRRAGGVATAASSTARGLELAYRYLNRRERTVHELRTYLLGHGVDAAAVDAVVDELIEAGYLDDARYARLFAQDKRELERWGTGRIRRTLLTRGVDPDVLESVLADTGSEFERALALLQQRFPDPPRERRDRQRALGVLVRRGYAPKLAIDAITAYSREAA